MVRTYLIGAAAVIVAGVGWYLFRPELLLVNRTANEAFPAAAASSPGKSPVFLASGQFHSVAHKTMGKATVYQAADGGKLLR